jgi:hypothetical protein
VSGLYFSWTNIDEIHGDHFRSKPSTTSILPETLKLSFDKPITDLSLKFILDNPYLWINDSILVGMDGEKIDLIDSATAIQVARNNIKKKFEVKSCQLIRNTSSGHEYRGRPLPAYAISFNTKDNMIAYVSARDGQFQRVRFRDWRWFDFLWMTHIMDYQDRDDINNWLLRAFSLFGLLTVVSGFALFFSTKNY